MQKEENLDEQIEIYFECEEINDKEAKEYIIDAVKGIRANEEEIKELIKMGSEVIPIMSYNAYNLDTKFGKTEDFINEIQEITGRKIIHTIQDAEPIGPKRLTDIMVVAPCSGNTMSKLANDIIDTPATMAVKSHLRNNLPVVIAPSTNNGLSRKCFKYCFFT